MPEKNPCKRIVDRNTRRNIKKEDRDATAAEMLERNIAREKGRRKKKEMRDIERKVLGGTSSRERKRRR